MKCSPLPKSTDTKVSWTCSYRVEVKSKWKIILHYSWVKRIIFLCCSLLSWMGQSVKCPSFSGVSCKWIVHRTDQNVCKKTSPLKNVNSRTHETIKYLLKWHEKGLQTDFWKKKVQRAKNVLPAFWLKIPVLGSPFEWNIVFSGDQRAHFFHDWAVCMGDVWSGCGDIHSCQMFVVVGESWTTLLIWWFLLPPTKTSCHSCSWRANRIFFPKSCSVLLPMVCYPHYHFGNSPFQFWRPSVIWEDISKEFIICSVSCQLKRVTDAPYFLKNHNSAVCHCWFATTGVLDPGSLLLHT